MSNINRLEKIVKSWTGQLFKKREYYYTPSDARMIISELGLMIRPELFTWITDNDVALDHFLSQLSESEEKLGKVLTVNYTEINPDFSPKVHEEASQLTFTATVKGKERIFAEIAIPIALRDPSKESLPKVESSDGENVSDIPVE